MEPEFDPISKEVKVSKEKSKVLLEWDLLYALKNYRENLDLFTVGEIRGMLQLLDDFETSVENFWEEN